MTRHPDGDRAGRDRLHAVLRGGTTVLAVALGLVAVWLIVTTDTRKGATVGALLGFWAILLGAYGVFGTRRPVLLAQPGHGLDVRAGDELVRLEDAGSRREYEYRLAEMLRREVQAAMSGELAAMRADVAALRSELVEKVGGQLRMERIETTRVIGSDIEALQHEVRQLMVARQPNDVGSFSLGPSHNGLISGGPERPTFTEAPSPAPAPAAASEAIASAPFSPAPADPEPASARPSPAAPPPPEPVAHKPSPRPFPLEPIAPEPVGSPSARSAFSPLGSRPADPEVSADPFASMPRLRPFTDIAFDPIETRSDDDAHDWRRHVDVARPSAGVPQPPNGTGEPVRSGGGRHANTDGDVHVPSGGGGGRRRRAAGEGDDMLARILQREGVR
ncbi:MAG: DUF6779 domain-containing protein [Jatrophihabitantaceae bacterium]